MLMQGRERMLDYIIFGAGSSGAIATNFLGINRVYCFVDNDDRKKEYLGKSVISVKELCKLTLDKFIVVIASEKSYREMESQIAELGVTQYFVFRENDIWESQYYWPKYWINRKLENMSYTEVLSHYPIRQYKNIYIIGKNKMISFLISEIAMISDISVIKGVICKKDNEGNTVGIREYLEITEITDADLFIINLPRKENTYLEFFKTTKADIIDIYDIDRFVPEYKNYELKKFKDIYKEKRIFLIGNGPSMSISDLNTLYENKEICIAFNKIHRIFGETDWRPNYIGMTDMDVISQVENEIDIYDIPLIISDRYNQMLKFNEKLKNANYVHMNEEEFGENLPRFSSDIVERVFWGNTSIYDIGIQFAAYMGAKEIYLIGVDHSMNGSIINPDNHFIKDYFRDDEKAKYSDRTYSFDMATLAYIAAREYAETHGFKIYNATRGGKLEVFERVNFDEIFKG